ERKPGPAFCRREAAGEPPQRQRPRSIVGVAALEPVLETKGIHERRAQAAGVVDDVRPHRWGEGKIRKLLPRIVSGDRRRSDRPHEQETDEHGAGDTPPAAHHATSTRGSTMASTMSDARTPAARNSEPTAAHPATRYRSRDTSASYISAPSPGHDITISTT